MANTQPTSLRIGKTYRVNEQCPRLCGEAVTLKEMKFNSEGKLAKLFVLVGLHSVEEVPVGSLVEIEP